MELTESVRQEGKVGRARRAPLLAVRAGQLQACGDCDLIVLNFTAVSLPHRNWDTFQLGEGANPLKIELDS